jgi:hypothetical protein
MNTKPWVLIFLAAALLAPGAFAQKIDLGISADIRLGRVAPPPPPEVVVVQGDHPSGPPPWSRGRFYQRSREYYYYPADDVYYRPSDHTWFYLEGRGWRSARSLPPGVRVDFDRSVMVTIPTDRPYEYHEKVRAYYPRDYFVSRVRIKERDHRDDRRDDHRDDRRDDRRRDDDHRDDDRDHRNHE